MAKQKQVRRWAIDSPKHGLLVMSRGDTKRQTSKFVSCEKGRKVVRVLVTVLGKGDNAK